MNDEVITYRLDKIDASIAELRGLVVSNALQEKRLTDAENEIKDLKKNKEKSRDKWLNPLISAVVSGVTAFVFVKVGLK